MDDFKISLEILRLYPSYSEQYTLSQFLNLFQEIKRFVSDGKNVAKSIYSDGESNWVCILKERLIS
ncbi:MULTISPECIES: hypothetical protein [Elizabethkingia]|nr:MULTISPECIES: hypothetical protein [Elizabethkingia]MCT4181850.1 hypothetical protein [Elizabethkingia anophelis]MDC8024921.1 hypothetical protein [Elizabethkingia anophelis]MDV3555182.1 hypothetical protein [Elizabethkingia anophelis]MDV3636695.1 hypothetical protein [Elizabethkingia anophelis]MDV3653212.1 hypothetical protein [Elizabethkingia anophelis]